MGKYKNIYSSLFTISLGIFNLAGTPYNLKKQKLINYMTLTLIISNYPITLS